MQEWGFAAGDYEQTFSAQRTAGTTRMLLIAGAVFAFAFAVLGFVVGIFVRLGQAAMQPLTTLPALIGIGCAYAARSIGSAPESVGVGPYGVRVVRKGVTRFYGWHEIGWASKSAGPYGFGQALVLFDNQGKRLERLPDALELFPVMVAAIEAHVQRRPDGTPVRIRASKARRQAVLNGIIGVLFLALSISVMVIHRNDRRAAALLQERAVPGRARIVRRFLAPNGITHRLVYRITTPDGRSGERNVEVDRQYWEELAQATEVPVNYVPGEPSISRLADHEVSRDEDASDPIIGFVAPLMLLLLALFSLGASAVVLCGWDVSVDYQHLKVRFRRLDEAT
jgi:hypothetical protein